MRNSDDIRKQRLLEISGTDADDLVFDHPEDTDSSRTQKLFQLLKHYPDKEAEALAIIDHGVLTAAVEENMTLLFHAAQNNSLNIIKALVEKGADVHQAIWDRYDDYRMTISTYLKDNSPAYYYVQNKIYPPTHCWMQYGENAVAEVQTTPSMQQKLTHVFNFATHEKMTIAENTQTGTISITPLSDFNDVAPQRLRDAAAAFKKINPDFDENSVAGFGKSRLDFTGGLK